MCVKYRMLAACGFVLVSTTEPVSSPGSTLAVLTWLQPLFVTSISSGIILSGTDGWFAQIWSWLIVTRRQSSIMAEWLCFCGGSATNFVLCNSSLVWIQTNSVLSKSEAPRCPVLVVSPRYGCAAGGGGEPLFIVDVCMCVSSSDSPPLVYFSLSYVSSPPPPVCVFPALFLTLGREE